MGIRIGTKSNDRVKRYGEVFTPNSVVNDMMNILDKEIYKTYNGLDYISKTFLEPACGNGQFLIVVLQRKLNEVNKLPVEIRQYGYIMAFCTIYGIDIQYDNVQESIERMYNIAIGNAVDTFDIDEKVNKIQFKPIDFEITDDMLKTVRYIMENNIVCGNAIEYNSDNNILFINYSFDHIGKTITLKTEPLNNNCQLNLFSTYYITIGESIPFDKLYTLRYVSDLHSENKAYKQESSLDEDDFDF